MLQIGNKEISSMYVGSTLVSEVYLGSTKIWPSGSNPDNEWYGVEFSGSATTGTRIGNLEYHKTLPLLSQMRRCVITNDQTGEAKFVKDDDYTQFEDGSTVDYVSVNDYSTYIMVYIPEFWYQSIQDDETNTWTLKVSAVEQEGWAYSPVLYVGASEACENLSGKLTSNLNGKSVLTDTPISEMQEKARANGNNWNAYTYKAHKAITFLFIVEYANRNSQATFNAELTAEGYHQGGLGTGLVDNGIDAITGGTMRDGNTTVGGNEIFISYRGIENPFGNVWKNCIDVWVTSHRFYYCEDSSKYTTTNTTSTDGYVLIGTLPNVNGRITRLYDNEIAVKEVLSSGSTSSYFCDRLYQNQYANKTITVGGYWNTGLDAGLLCLSCGFDRLSPDNNVGTRLTYEPKAQSENPLG